MINLILLGPPAAGKGTQAEILVKRRGLLQLSTGQMLRDAKAAGTELGKKAAPIMDVGGLVPDEIVIGLISERLDQPDTKNGVIFDGFPRTIPQAEALDKLLRSKDRKLDAVISVEVPDSQLLARLEKRVAETPPEKRRADDNPETFKKRLEAYHRDTKAVAPYYEAQGKLVHIDGTRPIDEVSAAIDAALDGAEPVGRTAGKFRKLWLVAAALFFIAAGVAFYADPADWVKPVLGAAFGGFFGVLAFSHRA
jgi:adenylate kinase